MVEQAVQASSRPENGICPGIPISASVLLFAEVSNETGTSEFGTKRASSNVRYPVANWGKPDVAQIARFGRVVIWPIMARCETYSTGDRPTLAA